MLKVKNLKLISLLLILFIEILSLGEMFASAVDENLLAFDISAQYMGHGYTIEEIVQKWNQLKPVTTGNSPYINQPVTTAPSYYEGSLTEITLRNAVNMVNFARFMADLNDVALDDTYNQQCQTGALVMASGGGFSHYPSQPYGMNDDMYKTGYAACGSSNIAWQSVGAFETALSNSVTMYLDDSDTSNIDRLGHRRWVLNPSMGKTGFGLAGAYSAMKAFDTSGSGTADYVAWPTAGYFPIELFKNPNSSLGQAWSLSLNSSLYSRTNTNSIEVTMVNKKTGETTVFTNGMAVSTYGKYFNIETSGYGMNFCIIFRPGNSAVNFGDEFSVIVSGLKNSSGASMPDISYDTSFMSAASYDVTYDVNGGTTVPAAQLKIHNIPLTLTTDIPTAPVFTVTYDANGGTVSSESKSFIATFNNWNTNARGTGASYAPGANYEENTTAILYAIWNNSAAGTLPTPTKSGYTFKGWYTATSGGTEVTSSTIITENITVYAQWAVNTYNVSYNANGGINEPASQTKTYDIPLTLTESTPVPPSYTVTYNANGGSVSPASKSINASFNKWTADAAGAGTSYSPGTVYTDNSELTLYAQWTSPAAGALPAPKRSGYSFKGWYTDASGGTEVTSDTIIMKNTIIYAHWSEESQTDKYLLGDADQDGKVTVKDATKIQKHVAKILTFTGLALKSADADEDGKISVKDATIIQKYVAKISVPNSRVGQFLP